MDFNEAAIDFLKTVAEDPRIAPIHISLFMAILYYYHEQGYQTPVYVHGKALRKQAKIAGMATYHKCIQDLKECGYIGYIPSHNPVLGSLVYLLKLES